MWRAFQALELKGSNQIAIYDDGVGTSSFKPLASLGGAFGYGLKRNVLNLYKFLCRNYQPGDKIYAFGFSRGAFTIRIVVGLVLNQGLVNFANESELDKKARAAYRAYRHDKYPAWNLQYPFRLARFLLDKLFYKSCERPIDSIEFVGVWDTVAAYGLPIDEMTRGVSEWIWPLELPNQEFNKMIVKARHALAIDDDAQPSIRFCGTRTKPTPSRAARAARPATNSYCRFGLPACIRRSVVDTLTTPSPMSPLAWMMAEAKEAGLSFKDMPDDEPQYPAVYNRQRTKDGRLYNSRSGLGG